MKLYKSPTNQIYAYEADGSQDNLIPMDYIAVTEQEANNIIANLVTAEQNKNTAMSLLQVTDWAISADVGNSQMANPYLANQAEFIAYRNAIRQYAIYPVSGKVNWIEVPQENWVKF